MSRVLRGLIVAVIVWAGLGAMPAAAEALFGTSVRTNGYDIEVTEPRFVIPSQALPEEVTPLKSNNNVDILFHEGRLYLAWRTAPDHFAGTQTRMYVISSSDEGRSWDFEHEIDLGADMREPRLLSFAGFLQLMFFEGGTDPRMFEPVRIWRTRRAGPGDWSDLELVSEKGEVPWDLKVREGVAYLTSYGGTDHYTMRETSNIDVFFRQSTDGLTWEPVKGDGIVYTGGASEVAFEFGDNGRLWAVTRNEDGDDTGFGAHVCTAPPEDLGNWTCSEKSDPRRFDSPEMFRHDNEIYLVARRDIGGPFDQADPTSDLAGRRVRNQVEYTVRPKRTALYRINKQTRTVEWLRDLPGVGDTAFPSVVQAGPDRFLLANYTTPLDEPEVTWLRGQLNPRGTQIYLAEIRFVPGEGAAPAQAPEADDGRPDLPVRPRVAFAVSPLNSFVTKEPAPMVADMVQRSWWPATWLAHDGTTLAFATDPTGEGRFALADMIRTPAPVDGEGRFASQPVDMQVEISSQEGPSGMYLDVKDAVYAGVLKDGDLQGPLTLEGRITFESAVETVSRFAGLDRETSHVWVISMYALDPEDPAQEIPFKAELPVQPVR